MDEQAAIDEPQGKKGPIRRYGPIGLILAGLVLTFSMGWHEYLTIDALRANREMLLGMVQDNFALSFVGFILLYAAMILLVPPSGTIMTLSSGFLFGTFWGGVATVMGATTGATLLFLATRTAFGDVLRNKAGPALAKMEAGFQKNAVSYMLFLRLVPAFPFFIVNIVPAFLGVPLRIFVITTAIGIIPGTFIYASLGAGLGNIISEEALNLGLILEPQYLLPILGLAVLALIPVMVNHFKARHGEST